MNFSQSHQQPNLDHSQLRPAYSPQNSLFPDAPLGAPSNLSSWSETVDDTGQIVPQADSVNHRAALGTEHTKHRRTRSGCYTCRQRRVKCDEARPQCQRCLKGSRPCTYPEPRSKTKTGSSTKSDTAKATTSIVEASDSEEEAESDMKNKEASAATEGNKCAGKGPQSKLASRNPARNKNSVARRKTAHSHKQPLPSIEPIEQDQKGGISPQTNESCSQSPSQSGSQSSRHMEHMTSESSLSPEKISLSHLPSMQRFYLEYLRSNVTYHHYFFRHDANYFLHHILIEQALTYEPLLHAVIGFAAFHATLGNPNGKIQDFLGYYNRSVSLLLKSLTSGQKHIDATLLTILQLAAIEEYLGDWVNLLGHQKAACSMLTELYSIDSIMDNELRRKILSWYTRFDLFAGFMSGYETILGREWAAVNENYLAEQAIQHPESIDCRIEAAVASHRVIALDMVMLFSKLPRGAITLEEFKLENEKIAMRIQDWKISLEPLLSDDRYLVESFAGAREREEDDIVDPYRPGGLYQGPLWTLNFLRMDYLGMDITHTYQTALMLQQSPPPGLVDMALEMCRLFEAIQYWRRSPPGAILSAQAGLGIAVIFLPKTDRHISWCRRKLAAVESQGYTYPPTMRGKLANLWGIPQLRQWWLPNEEGYPPIIRSIRAFIEERTQKSGNQPKAEDVRTMKGLFDKLNIDDSPDNSAGSSIHGTKPKRF
ncbi:MAG: hypothetical protein Q9182_000438 [Xanthomendoza sp. 2 TL-2023]